MPPSVTETIVHERRIEVRLHRDDVRRLVAETVAREAGVRLASPATDFDVTFEDAIGATVFDAFSARVRIVVDLTAGVPDPAHPDGS